MRSTLSTSLPCLNGGEATNEYNRDIRTNVMSIFIYKTITPSTVANEKNRESNRAAPSLKGHVITLVKSLLGGKMTS
jgi:hypothetical protein